jgi:hypothetical protein
MKQAVFIQPRHPNAPSTGFGQIYLPTALLTAASRAMTAGGNLTIHDENLRTVSAEELREADYVCTNTIGPSCLPTTIDLQRRIQKTNPEMKFLMGGQVISSLDRLPYVAAPRFDRLFGPSAENGNSDAILEQRLGLQKLAPASETSLIPAYELLKNEDLKAYLSTRFSFFVAQGCKYKCTFCSAVNGVPETYRATEVMKHDLGWLVQKAISFDISQLTMYMSNLDISQTPGKLMEFAAAVKDVKTQAPGFSIQLTALSTVAEFKKIEKNHPNALYAMIEAGLTNLAFGVEGMSPDYWSKLKKGHNKMDDCYNMIRDSVERFGLTTEILLTPGHEHETPETLATTVDYAEYMKEKYGDKVVIRPYAAKVWLTGNAGWHGGKYDAQIEEVMKNPELFQNLDINALQSRLVEPDDKKRDLVNKAFVHLCELSKGDAPYLLPIEKGSSADEIARVKEFNTGKYDH